MAYTWTDLLDDIKVRGSIPTSQSTYTAARFLSMANAVMKSKIAPLVMSAREGYYSYDDDRTISTLTGGVMAISPRAVGGKLLSARFVDGTRWKFATRYYEDEISDTGTAPGMNPGFYVKRNSLVIVPATGVNWSTFRMTIPIRPNTIVDPTTDAAQITGINTGTKTITCSTVPSSWTTASILDILQAEDHFDWLAIDQVITAITTGTSGTITFSSTLPSSLVLNDWVALARKSPTIQCPSEFHPLLAQEVANVFLSQRDKTAYELGLEEAKMLEKSVSIATKDRVEGAGQKLTNRTGILRRGI